MNFSLLRYLAVFSAAYLAVNVLGIVELVWLALSLEFEFNRYLGSRFLFLYPGIFFGQYIVDQFFAMLIVICLVVFAISALVEGYYYYNRNSAVPSNASMLSGSVAMAVSGIGVIYLAILLIYFIALEDLSLLEFGFDFWEYYWIAALVVTASIVCRVAFGVGLRQAQPVTKGIAK
ncbi:hypothetical protein [Ruegeria atlantica]|uniref:hypothetical protein n=1 Tax=Ruegeria atlantica TaxID=81569 RepID=UPI00147B8366|nr:hypothetical protein [Ruegeria atlantica]